MTNKKAFDYIVVGAGSAGCVLASELARREVGKILLLEAGPSNNSPLVKMPFGLVWMIGSKKRDWLFKSVPQTMLDGREIDVTRGRMVGGSGSINSMVWFRGRAKDYEDWKLKDWRWQEVEKAFTAIEKRINPQRMNGAHPLSEGLHSIFQQNSVEPPNPEYESAGVFLYNMRNGRRNSAADAFLNPLQPNLKIYVKTEVDKILFENKRAIGIVLNDGSQIRANKGVILSAGSICSPSILMRSGIGPKKHLQNLDIKICFDSTEVGKNLQDHPSVGLHYAGPNSGYGITIQQGPAWALAPLRYLLNRSGRLASPTVEGGGFFHSIQGEYPPNLQIHFMPFKSGDGDKRYVYGSGYTADICVCKPKSRGTLQLYSKDPLAAPKIDLGLLSAQEDWDTLVQGLERLRDLMERADFGQYRAPEVSPGPSVVSGNGLHEYVKKNCATAYHPVGTLRMGEDKQAPVSPRLTVNGVDNLWVADASVMPEITSANTNAPSMMIGFLAAKFIAEDKA
jgi:choline dehydrogenase